MIYYTETNLITIIVGFILMIQGSRRSSKNETSHLLMQLMLSSLIVFSMGDICAYCARGMSYILVEISNIIYFISMAIGCYLWFLFVILKMERVNQLKRTVMLTCIPIVLLCLAMICNPFTEYFFSVDENLFYHRGPGVVLSWIVEWGYILWAFVVNIIVVCKEKRNYKKSEYIGYLFFLLPIAVAAICQMKFYGTTTTQVGFMIALLMAFLNKQHFQEHMDDLTGLKNKNAFLMYRDTLVGQSEPVPLTFFMIDANRFKAINDSYGHMKGDQALKDIADVLQNAVSDMRMKDLLLFRYAGDEFVIIGENFPQEAIAELLELIRGNITIKNMHNREKGEEYHLDLSIGYKEMMCSNLSDFDDLVMMADEEMYRIKKDIEKNQGSKH